MEGRWDTPQSLAELANLLGVDDGSHWFLQPQLLGLGSMEESDHSRREDLQMSRGKQ